MMIPEVLRQWNLESVERIHEIVVGAVNRVYKIETPAANYYLRVYKSLDPATLIREQSLITQVRSHGVPAARPLPTVKGKLFTTHSEKLVALYTEAAGSHIGRQDLNVAHAQAAGRMLAQIHLATRDFPNQGYRIYNLSWDKSAWVEKLNHIERLILARPSHLESDQWALRRLQEQRRWLQNSRCSHHYVPKNPSQVLHGDYHDGNLFFKDGAVSGVIDWDQSTFMPRAFEVIRAASYMFGLEKDRTWAFIGAYREIFPLSEAELEDGAMGWGHRSDHYVWAVEEVYIHGNERARIFIPHRPFLPFQETWSQIRK